MQWWRRWRADLVRPERPTSRADIGWLAGGAFAIVVVSQLTDPGSSAELLVASSAVGGFLLRALVPRLPAEVFAVLVIVPVTAVASTSGRLEGVLFLNVTMVLFASWSLGSTTRAVLITTAAAAIPWLVAIAGDTVAAKETAWQTWVLANGLTFVLGRNLHHQRRLIGELEQARSALADQAVADERRRIARELHDLAGHTLAAMLLHVTGPATSCGATSTKLRGPWGTPRR